MGLFGKDGMNPFDKMFDIDGDGKLDVFEKSSQLGFGYMAINDDDDNLDDFEDDDDLDDDDF